MEMAIYPLEKNEKNHFICPKCRKDLHYVSGGAVRIVDGRADMSAVLPKYECHQCGIYHDEWNYTATSDIKGTGNHIGG